MTDRPPAVVLSELSQIRQAMELARKACNDSRTILANAEYAYEKKLAVWFLGYEASIKAKGEKGAAEGTRKILAHAEMDEQIWKDVLFAKASVDAQQRTERLLMAEATALEAELAFLRQELASMPREEVLSG